MTLLAKSTDVSNQLNYDAQLDTCQSPKQNKVKNMLARTYGEI